jgi:hypothetical protein
MVISRIGGVQVSTDLKRRQEKFDSDGSSEEAKLGLSEAKKTLKDTFGQGRFHVVVEGYEYPEILVFELMQAIFLREMQVRTTL